MSTQPTRQSPAILAAMAFCLALEMTGFWMLLPLFALRFDSFGAGVKAFGISSIAYALAGTFAAPFAGMLADRFGRRPIILLSLAAHVLTFIGYLLASSAWVLILLRGMSGVIIAGLLPAMMSIVGDLAQQDRRAQWIGIVNGGASAGWVFGPMLGGQLYDHFGYVVPFATSITLAAGALFLAVFCILETNTRAVRAGRPAFSWRPAWQALNARQAFLLLMLITFGVMFAWAFIEPQFMFYAYDDLNWSSSQLGLAISAYGVAFMTGGFALGRLSDRLGRKPVLVLGLVLFSAQFIGLVFFRQMTWIAVSFILAGLGNALYDTALSAMVLDITPPKHTAGMLGLKSTAGSLGSLLGPSLVVLVTPFASPQVIFLIAAAVVALLVLSSGLALRLPKTIEVTPPHLTGSAVER